MLFQVFSIKFDRCKLVKILKYVFLFSCCNGAAVGSNDFKSSVVIY